MVTSQDWGGAQAYVFGLAQEMKTRGLPVAICAGRSPSLALREGTGGELGFRCREADIRFIPLKHMVRNINPLRNLLSLWEMAALFRREKPYAIQLNSTMMGAVGSCAGWMAHVPKIVYVAHGWVFEEALASWKKVLYIWIEKLTARFKHVIICLHPKDQVLADELHIKPREKILTIPNGIDVERFEIGLLDREQAIQSLYPLPLSPTNVGERADPAPFPLRTGERDGDRGLVVGTVANAYPPKNLLWYLDTCKSVHEIKPDVRFVIIGDGPQIDELRAKHAALHQEGYVLLAGRRTDAARLYRAFDLFALPSTKEGMPITLLEAMAARVPIIATDVGANRWMLGDNAGVIVPANDQETMVRSILDLVDDEPQRKTLAEKAYAQAKNRFAWSKTVSETIKSLSPSS